MVSGWTLLEREMGDFAIGPFSADPQSVVQIAPSALLSIYIYNGVYVLILRGGVITTNVTTPSAPLGLCLKSREPCDTSLS